MRTKSQPKTIRFGFTLSRLRIATASLFVLGAAALAATSMMMPPKLPWGVRTVTVGNDPVGMAVDTARHTIYVANGGDNTLSVIDSSRCNSGNSSRCVPVATLNVGSNPLYLAFDSTTDTIYATLPGPSFDGNQVAVVNGATCNATNTSGCGQTPATVTVPGAIVLGLALDTATHTLYVGDANEGPISIIDTAICNATNTSGCGQTPVQTAAGGDTITIDYINHGVYVSDYFDNLVRVFSGATCNAGNTSSCAERPATLAANFNPIQAAVDEVTHTVYVPLQSEGRLNFVLMIDGSTCNGTINSGCGNTPNRANVGSGSAMALVDPATETVYVQNQGSRSISVINGATCNATRTDGCPNIAPALAVGVDGAFVSFDPNTHTLYESSQDTNTVWVLDTHECNAMHTGGCTKFAPKTTVGAAPWGIVESVQTKTLYVANQFDNTVSIIDTRVCNQRHLSGCNQSWPTINVGDAPRFNAINNVTNTLYVANFNDHNISVINAATCNNQNTSNCAQLATIPVGAGPQQLVVDAASNTIYIVNQSSNNMSVINGAHCNASDVSACNQAWPTVGVGARPQGLGFSPARRTLYVANTSDNTVSVISTVHCTGGDTSGCTPVATVPVGAAPRAIGVVDPTNTIFVGNRDDLTVSVFDSSKCNGNNASDCPQIPPPAFVVGAFPDTAGINDNIFGRAIVFSSKKHTLYMPVIGDSDVAEVDTNPCRAGHVNDCHVKIADKRMGGNPLGATVDDATDTVYVVNINDGTVSVLPSSF